MINRLVRARAGGPPPVSVLNIASTSSLAHDEDPGGSTTMQSSSRGAFDGLFARAQSGDEDAWEELFRQCYPKVVRVVRRRLNQPMRSLYDSADFASDVWRSLLAKSDRFDFPTIASLMAFLEKAATQKVIDEHRRLHSLKRDQRRTTSLDAGLDGFGPALPLASADPTPSQYAVANEGWQRANDRLDETHRRVLEMARQGYSTREIADEVDWSIRKVQRELKEMGDSWLSDQGRRP
jgi:RNA polymerase sigma-70 factor (ECF subfamily)